MYYYYNNIKILTVCLSQDMAWLFSKDHDGAFNKVVKRNFPNGIFSKATNMTLAKKCLVDFIKAGEVRVPRTASREFFKYPVEEPITVHRAISSSREAKPKNKKKVPQAPSPAPSPAQSLVQSQPQSLLAPHHAAAPSAPGVHYNLGGNVPAGTIIYPPGSLYISFIYLFIKFIYSFIYSFMPCT